MNNYLELWTAYYQFKSVRMWTTLEAVMTIWTIQCEFGIRLQTGEIFQKKKKWTEDYFM